MRFASWLRRFRLITRSTQPISQRRTSARQRRRANAPVVRRLEDRTVPSTVTWTGAAGDFNWDTAGNWDSGKLPGPADNVFINQTGITITHSNAADADAVANVYSDSLINVSAGSLSIGGSVDGISGFPSGLTVSGGAVSIGAGVNPNNALSLSSLTVSGGSFTDLCLAGTYPTTLTLSGGSITLGGDLTLAGNLAMSGGTLTAGTANVTVSHSLDWSGGTIAGYTYQSLGITYPQGTVTVDGELILGAADAVAHNEVLDGTTLINNYFGGGFNGVDADSQLLGTSGSFTQKNGSVFQNNAGDEFDINCNLPWFSDGTATIDNRGVIQKTPAIPGSATLHPQLANSGYVYVDPGTTLSLTGGGTQTGTFYTYGTLGFDGGNFKLLTAAEPMQR
jgi:hypothetical protein